MWASTERANKIHPLYSHTSTDHPARPVTSLAAHPWKPDCTTLQGLLLYSSSYLCILGSSTSLGKGHCSNWYPWNCCLFQSQGPRVFQLFLSVQSWSLCSKGFSLRDTHTPQVSIVVKLYPYRVQNAGSSVSALLNCFLQGIHGPCGVPLLSVGGPTPKSTAFMLVSPWWVGAGGVCRWKEEALHCPREREAPGGRNSSSPVSMGWLLPCWKSWAKSWVSPLPMAPEDRTSGYEWISVLRTNQSIAGLWVCFSLCQKCHLLLSYLYLVNSSPQLCLQWSSALSIMVLITAASCLPPLDWGLLETSTRCPQGVKRHLMNAWIKVGVQRKAWTTGPQALMKWGRLQVSEPLPGIQEVKLFSLQYKTGPANFFWKRSDKYFRLCRSLVSVISTQLCFYRVTAAINNR